MRLIDCTYLNSPGGKKILKIFLDKMPSNELKKFNFIIDFRADITTLNKLKNTQYKLIKNSELNRRAYYNSIKNKIEKCICLANVPPPIKLECDVVIYFHNDLLLNPRLSLSFSRSLSFFIKKNYIKIVNSKEYKWIVQTDLMKKKLSNYLLIKSENINVIPIFTNFTIKLNSIKTPNSFLYVCSSSPHKNLKRLIQAFNQIKNVNSKSLCLDLTIPDKSFFQKEILQKNKNNNLVIKNNINLNESSIKKLYSKSEYLIYPSVVESFGLPLIESIEFKCKILASNLPYVKEIIKPSVTFDPFSVSSIADSIDYVIDKNNIVDSEMLIQNKIDKFIELIKS